MARKSKKDALCGHSLLHHSAVALKFPWRFINIGALPRRCRPYYLRKVALSKTGQNTTTECESTSAVASPPATARFLMGDHAGMALAPGAHLTALVATTAQAEVCLAYEAAADLERRCAGVEHLRHDDDTCVSEHVAVMLPHATLLATDARRRPNEDAAQAQLEATRIRGACDTALPVALGTQAMACSPPTGAASFPAPPVPASAPWSLATRSVPRATHRAALSLPVPILAGACVATGQVYACMMRRDIGLNHFDPDSSDDYVPVLT